MSASIYATDSGVERELIPTGNHVARCFSMVHIGTVQGTFGIQNKVRIGWELPEELRVFDQAKGEQPMVIFQEFSLSMNAKANLRKMLASWRGKDFSPEEAKKFDITKLIGVPCMLNIIHKPGIQDPSKTYQTISGVSTVPKSMKVPKQILPAQVLSFESWDEEMFQSLPEYLRNKIVVSKEYQELKNPSHVNTVNDFGDNGSDLPF